MAKLLVIEKFFLISNLDFLIQYYLWLEILKGKVIRLQRYKNSDLRQEIRLFFITKSLRSYFESQGMILIIILRNIYKNLIIELLQLVQGVLGNMTVAEYFKMSSSVMLFDIKENNNQHYNSFITAKSIPSSIYWSKRFFYRTKLQKSY